MTTRVPAGEHLAEPPSRDGGRLQRLCGEGRRGAVLRCLLAAGALGASAAWAQPDAAGVEVAAMALGSADLSPALRAAWPSGKPEPQGLVLEAPPALSLSTTRAEPAYRFRGSESNELQSLSYRWWLGSGRAAVGFGLGSIGYVVQLPAEGDQAATTVVGSVPTASIGLRYALSPTTQAYADGSRTAGLAGQDAVFYNAKAGIEWKPVKSRFGFEGGRFGVQLDSGYRMSLRTRKGGLSIYLRRTF